MDLTDNDWSFQVTGMARTCCGITFNSLAQNTDTRLALTTNDENASRQLFFYFSNYLGTTTQMPFGCIDYYVEDPSNTYKVEVYQNDTTSEAVSATSNTTWIVTHIVPD